MAPYLVASVLLGLVFASVTNADAIYTKDSPVLQVDSKSYDSLIARSNYTSIVEFYAPWCGHCKALKPAYEKAANNLAGYAKVAAVNCDEESNKPLCGQMGVKGFPTLKIVRPGSKPGKPIVEDYQGERSAKAIADAVTGKIPNHVKRLQDVDVEAWLAERNETAKAILFTDKGTTSSLIRAVAIEFLGKVSVGQIRSKETTAVETFGISKFPTLVLLPGGTKEAVVYDGELKKQPIVAFLSQIAPPNPDPAPKPARASSKKPNAAKASSSKKFQPEQKSSFQESKTSEASSSVPSQPAEASSSKTIPSKESQPVKISISPSSAASEASASQLPLGAAEAAASGFHFDILEDFDESDLPQPIVSQGPKPIVVPDPAPEIATLATPGELNSACLGSKTGTCMLALLPARSSPDASQPEHVVQALKSLAEIADKHVRRKAKFFPFYAVPAENEAAKTLRGELGLKAQTELEIIALNGKRNWWRHFAGENTQLATIESFIDAIKFGEGKKDKLPGSVILQEVEEEREEEEEAKAEHDEL